ncbi:hypothetical protein [Bacillus tropicus]|nr:hypothetical protein [Bacillus tropicus]
MIFENVTTIGALAFLFLMIYLATTHNEVSLPTISAYSVRVWGASTH